MVFVCCMIIGPNDVCVTTLSGDDTTRTDPKGVKGTRPGGTLYTYPNKVARKTFCGWLTMFLVTDLISLQLLFLETFDKVVHIPHLLQPLCGACCFTGLRQATCRSYFVSTKQNLMRVKP